MRKITISVTVEILVLEDFDQYELEKKVIDHINTDTTTIYSVCTNCNKERLTYSGGGGE